MKPDRNLERQLENLRKEANVIASYVYAEMTIQHAASRSAKLLGRLNRTPTFWTTCLAALQTAAYVGLGRVFDLRSPYNIEQLLISVEENLEMFSREALASRKRRDGVLRGSELNEYIARAHALTRRDVQALRRSVARRRAFYERAIMPARHQFLAHRQAVDAQRVAGLYARGKLRELWRLAVYLLKFHEALQDLFLNGRRPSLRIGRYSPRVMFTRPNHAAGVHERLVRDTGVLMHFIEHGQFPS